MTPMLGAGTSGSWSREGRRRRLLERALPLFSIAFAAILGAQPSPEFRVRVRVADSSGAPIPGAEVSVVRGFKTPVTQGLTDGDGLRTLVVPRDDEGATYNLVVRRIGFRRADRFFAPLSRPVVSFDLRIARLPQTLAPVRVTARENAARKAYHIDADEIEASDRVLFHAGDIVEKLRPDIVSGRSEDCGGVREVFVNGIRIQDAPQNAIDMAVARSRPPAGRNPVSGRVIKNRMNARPAGLVAGILAAIRPEHVEEMQYNDCFEKSIKINRGANALFIVLKPGVAYSEKSGSYVIDGDTAVRRPAGRKP